MRKLLARLRRGRSKRRPAPIDAERLHRIYREAHREMEDLRRAA